MAVQLGVAQRAPRLRVERFPLGKVAGEPLWLVPGGTTECQSCAEHMTFLLQVYSPLEDFPQAYHRYLYVFLCRRCKSVRVLRCQLPQHNSLYPEAPPEEVKATDDELSDEQLLALLAGTQSEAQPVQKEEKPDIELEIVEEHQDISTAARELYGLNLLDSQAVEDFTERLPADPSAPKNVAEEAQEIDEDEADALESIVKEHHKVETDVSFELFRLASRFESKQCIRYDRKGAPLWYSDKGRPSLSVPNCQHCGSRRIFEFQVMPQVIDVGHFEDVDFGALYVFTCENSCGEGAYFAEHAVMQESL